MCAVVWILFDRDRNFSCCWGAGELRFTFYFIGFDRGLGYYLFLYLVWKGLERCLNLSSKFTFFLFLVFLKTGSCSKVYISSYSSTSTLSANLPLFSPSSFVYITP